MLDALTRPCRCGADCQQPGRARRHEVPATIFGDLVAVADRDEPIIMQRSDGAQLRALAGQIVGMTGGFRA